MLPFRNISGLRVSLASPEQIRLWSSGEVTKAETINYRTLKPERDGLFCERIFGPAKDWTCACGKYKRPRYKDHVCENCGVTIAPARSRRLRMGHIELAAPVSHVWFARGMPSRIGLLLDLSPRELDRVLTFTHYIVTHVEEALRLSEVQRVKADIAHVAAMPGDVYEMEVLHELPSDLVEVDGEEDEGEDDGEQDEGEDDQEPETLYISKQERVRQLQQVLKQLTELRCYKLLEIEQYRLLRDECAQVFEAGIGAEVIQDMLGTIDLELLARSLRQELYEKEGASRSRAIKRLKIVEALRHAHINPQWMILNIIPVLPPDLRPVLALDGGRFAASDINELYCRVIHRNNRLKRFLESGAPEIIIFHEKRALQEACDALFDNAHCRRPLVGANRKPLRSLSDALRGKEGRFRHNLLGKRVDYSGRSVISVGLDLKLYQCGLPKKIALELFKPFIINRLIAYDYVQTPRQAKKAVERRQPEVWDVLDEVMRDRLVLLNRAPTLHRLSIQAFVPILVEGNAIRLHPQVCSPFNADFDGDQMAVHLPLSPEAQKEARELMLSTRNLLSPASGEPTISVSQEMVLGCYYLTQERPGKKGEGRIFSDGNEAVMAYSHGVIDLQARISVRMAVETIYHQPSPAPAEPHIKGKRLDTTVGRILFNAVLPKNLRFKNYAMKKEHLKQILWDCIKQYGLERTAIMADAIKRLGFSNATKAGISFAISDVTVPPAKKQLLADAGVIIQELRDSWSAGLITRDELYQQTIAVWQKTTDQIAQHVQEVLDPYGSVATISSSGATKAKLQQIRQLSGMRGLMASPSGAIIETPVRGNFLEGLTVAEYFLSSHGARKSLMDRSLNTAEAGYLTIRLVNVAQDVIVTEEDCGTPDGLLITDDDNKKMGLSDGRTRLFGRVLAEALPQVGLSAGDELHEAAVEAILAARIPVVRVRSVFVCQAKHGVCRVCYGWDLSKRALVKLGTAVGIIAAQSIGEPGTQLTMRTFHSGGIAGGQGDITQGLPRVEELFEGRVPREQATTTEIEGVVGITKDDESGRQSVEVVATTIILDEYPLSPGCLILLKGTHDTRVVAQGEAVAVLPPGGAEEERLVRARLAGTLFMNPDGVLTIRAEEHSTRSYMVPHGRSLIVSDGQHVQAGEPLTTGALNLQDTLRSRGRVELELYLLKEAQAVYRTTGAYIHDKHFEIIIRQMLRYAQVEHPGDTNLLPEDLVDRFACADINAHILAQGGEPAVIRSVLLGLTRATLATKSWLAAASFQQTSRILTDAALAGQTDYLVGLKENVILGKLIPAGTGILPRTTSSRTMPMKPGRRGRPRKDRSA